MDKKYNQQITDAIKSSFGIPKRYRGMCLLVNSYMHS